MLIIQGRAQNTAFQFNKAFNKSVVKIIQKCIFVRSLATTPTTTNESCLNTTVFDAFACRIFEKMDQLKTEVIKPSEGQVANYIPQLALACPETFAISLCSVKGKLRSHGDYRERFSIQSCVKPFTYLMAMEQHGSAKVHEYIGMEPSGKGFNAFTFDEHNRPHNPMINAGAMVATSMLWPTLEPMQRFQKLTRSFDSFIEDSPKQDSVHFDFDYATYKSERESGFKNYALAFLMNDNNALFGEQKLKADELVESLHLYYQACSIELDVRGASILAAILARGGKSPFTDDKILFDRDNVVKCCQIMSSCGMYDYSGAWSCAVGLPSKSGVSGCILVIIPNLMGIAIYSPPLDSKGNSFRGMKICEYMTEQYNLNMYRQLQNMDRDVLANNIYNMNYNQLHDKNTGK